MSRLVALTGATGFVGGHVLAALAAAGWRIRILARTAPRLSLPPGVSVVEVVPGSLSDPQALVALAAEADAIVHIAGAVRARNRARFMAANAEGTAAVARAWRASAPDAPFVLVSSLAAREPELSDYAASKRAGEELLRSIASGASWHILRPAAVYGPRDRETLTVFRAARASVQPLLNGPRARVCLIEVSDLAAAVLACLDPALPSGTWEVTDARTDGYSWREIVEAAATAVGGRRRMIPIPRPLLRAVGQAGDMAAMIGAPAAITSGKVCEILHADWSSTPESQLPSRTWKPRIGLTEGFARAVAWYRLEGWLPR